MIDEREVQEMLHRRADSVPTVAVDTPTAVRRARRRLFVNAMVATVVVAAIAVATFSGVDAIQSAPVPADDPSQQLGTFEPVAGRIVYVNEGTDLGSDHGLWGVEPSGPADTTAGPNISDDVASTLVPLDFEDVFPSGWPSERIKLGLLGWSSDGTELLFARRNETFAEFLYILHADGSETRLNKDQLTNAHAAISPDGSRVVIADQGDASGLTVVDPEGGRPVPLPIPQAEEPLGAVTFSPDGTQIAYLANDGVWVTNADGTDAHQILTKGTTGRIFGGASALEWSPAGDRLAIGLGGYYVGGGRPGIYTFAPDGSAFTQVITGGIWPYWSPDGSQIVYTIPCDIHPSASCAEGTPLRSEFDPQAGESPAGLAIADADGTNVRAFGFAASGPWHPGASVDDVVG